MEIETQWMHFESIVGKKVSYESGCPWGRSDRGGDMIKDCECEYTDIETEEVKKEWKNKN